MKKILFIIFITTMLIISGCESSDSMEQISSQNNTFSEEPKEMEPNQKTTIEENTEDSLAITPEPNEILSEEEFKAQCEELWHDDIFFTQESLEGKYIKVKVMVEENRFFDFDPNTLLPEEYTKGNDLEKDFLYCGVKRADKETYVGGTLTVYFSPDYNCYDKDIEPGNYLIIYGEVLSFDIESNNGYNSCSLIARYIESSER